MVFIPEVITTTRFISLTMNLTSSLLSLCKQLYFLHFTFSSANINESNFRRKKNTLKLIPLKVKIYNETKTKFAHI